MKIKLSDNNKIAFFHLLDFGGELLKMEEYFILFGFNYLTVGVFPINLMIGDILTPTTVVSDHKIESLFLEKYLVVRKIKKLYSFYYSLRLTTTVY